MEEENNEETKQPNETDTLFERTDKAAERIELANKRTEDLLNRQEALYAKQKLGGQSTAGKEEEVEEVISDADYVKGVMDGTIGE
jgi:hypothetical protein